MNDRTAMNDRLSHVVHLARRFVGSWSRRDVSDLDRSWVRAQLSDDLYGWWATMPVADRRHSVIVARRFADIRPQATVAEVGAALLHDAGKQAADLSTIGRVMATVCGPRTRRFRAYHDHERVGADVAARLGAPAEMIELIAGHGPAAADLRRADFV